MGMARLVLMVSLIVAATYAPGAADETISGPVSADVIEVVDGDTITVLAFPWPGQAIQATVSIRGIIAPALDGECGRERGTAATARDTMIEVLQGFQNQVELTDINLGATEDEIIATVSAYGLRLSDALLTYQLAVPDDGTALPWCE